MATAAGCCRMLPPADAMDAPPEEMSSTFDADAVYGRIWLLEDIEGNGTVDNLDVPIQFNEIGIASGSTGCNRFSGSIVLGNGTVEVGPLAITEMACAEAVMLQERRMLDALARVWAWRMENGLLILSDETGRDLLRFAPAG